MKYLKFSYRKILGAMISIYCFADPIEAAMNKEKYVFDQLISFLNEDKFRSIVDRYQGNRYVKQFTCWSQLLGQFSNRESLRNLIIALEVYAIA